MADFFAKGNKPINGYGGGNLASKSDLTDIFQTGSTATQAISAGIYFYLNGTLVRAKTDIANGATFTENTNYEVVSEGALNDYKDFGEERIIGKLGNATLYERTYYDPNCGTKSSTFNIDSNLKNINPVMISGIYYTSSVWFYCFNQSPTGGILPLWDATNGLRMYLINGSLSGYSVVIRYTK